MIWRVGGVGARCGAANAAMDESLPYHILLPEAAVVSYIA